MIPDSYFERFSTPKYRNQNPVQRSLIRRFATRLHALFVAACPATTVLEVGVGQGFLSGYLSERFPEKRFVGVDVSERDLAELRRLFPRLTTFVASAYDLSDALAGQPFDIVICAEVLEHLDRPEAALDQLLKLAPRHVLLTVPHEPWFMLSNLLRGKNVTRFGNDPEHVNHWNGRSFRRLLEGRFHVIEMTTSYPWLLALAAPK
jgi:2-polyprenyl-3-methyl-5-hydroxy-6-metoxy-1,4-benzoquinol methylase